jgi:hypothetical protein
LGRHPAFDMSQPSRSVAERVLRASPVKFLTIDGRIEAINQDEFTPRQIEERSDRLLALRRHVRDLIDEAESRQVPGLFVARLQRYSHALNEEAPLFVVIDAAMSFLRGALRDPYLTAALDGGFVEASQELLRFHNALRKRFVRDDEGASLMFDQLDERASQDIVLSVVSESLAIISNPALGADVGESVVRTFEALQEYIAATDAPRADKGYVIKQGLLAVSSTLASLLFTAEVHPWVVEEAGRRIVWSLQEVYNTVLDFIGFEREI